MATGTHVSTVALSVYNALSLSGRDLTSDEALDWLRVAWMQELELAEVEASVAYLSKRNLVRLDGGHVAPLERDPATRRARPLRRMQDGTELGY